MRLNQNSGGIVSDGIGEIISSKRQVCDEAAVTLSKCREMMAAVNSAFAEYRAKLGSKGISTGDKHDDENKFVQE